MTLRTKPETLDTFLIFDAEDPLNASVCKGETEAREIIDQFACTAGLQILRITMGELTRDVTADFITDEDEPDEYPEADLEASIADRRHQLRMEGAI